MSWFFCRNFAGQKGVAWYIQGDEMRKSYNQEYLARLSFRDKIKNSDKQKLKEFRTTKQALREMLTWLLKVEKKRPQLEI